MERLFDELAVGLICLIGFASWGGSAAPVVGFLVMLILTAFTQLYRKTVVASILIFISAGICGVFPIYMCALPLILFNALWEKRWWLVCPAIGIFFGREYMDNPIVILIIAVGCAISLILYYRLQGLEHLVDVMEGYRDEVKEASIALKNKNSYLIKTQDDEVYMATLKERNRIAREIHDNVGHMLTRSLLQAGALAVVNSDDKLKEPIESLTNSLDEAMLSIRSSVHDLHDDSINLKKAIEDSIDTVSNRFDVEFEYDVETDMSGQIKLCVAGIVKEALSNIAKHSSGDRVKIDFREHPGFYRLIVEDNGHPRETSDTMGIGLQNMKDRAASVSGRIEFTASEFGFRVFLRVPRGSSV